MTNIRIAALTAALGGVVLLSGCVAPGGVYSDGYDPGYGQPYYSDPSPVYVAPPVYVEGGYYGRGYRGNPYYGNRGYYNGRPGYVPPRPGYAPGGSVPRPGFGVRPTPPVARPTAPRGVPPPVFVPPSSRGPGAIVQPSWNNPEKP